MWAYFSELIGVYYACEHHSLQPSNSAFYHRIDVYNNLLVLPKVIDRPVPSSRVSDGCPTLCNCHHGCIGAHCKLASESWYCRLATLSAFSVQKLWRHLLTLSAFGSLVGLFSSSLRRQKLLLLLKSLTVS